MNIVVIGLGITGLSCVRFFVRKGYSVRAMDTRSDPPEKEAMEQEFPDVKVSLGELREDWLSHAQQVIVSPGLSVLHPAIQRAKEAGALIRGDVDVFAEYAKAPLVGITGSNGKGTVTSWVEDMGKAAGKNFLACGNIGIPVLDILEEPTPDAYILELSSFQLETTHHLKLKAATILNISADHLDRYADMNAYIEAKQRIYHDCDTAIFYRAQKTETAPIDKVAHVISFGLDVPAEGHYGVIHSGDRDWLSLGKELLFPADELSLPGRHNELNALAALALGHSLGLSWDDMAKSLARFSGLPHRCQLVSEIKGVQWVNDSKGTNVGATLAAIEGLAPGLSGKLLIILGGDGKGADFSPLLEPLAQYAKAAVVLGQDADKLQSLLGSVLPVHRVNTLKEAVLKSAELAESHDMVLLSPACSSLDMFKNYEARGDEFMHWVHGLEKK